MEGKEEDCVTIRGPFDCPVYRANLESAALTDCGLCVCTHCLQQSSESDKTCAICSQPFRSHLFSERDKDSPEVTDSLFKIKDLEIEKRDEIIKERDRTIEELTENEEDLRRQLERLEQEKEQQIKDLNKTLTEKDTELQDMYNNIIPDKEKTVADILSIIDQYSETLTEKDTELQDVYDNILPEKENTIADLLSEIKQYSEKLDRTQNEVSRLQAEVEHLQPYVQLCAEQNAQLHNLLEKILPERDRTIAELQEQVAQLSEEVSQLIRTTVFVSNVQALSETNLSRAIEQLQHFYDREYRCRYEITEKMEVLLQTRLQDVVNGLCTDREIGDQLALLISTYVSLVEENSNLHRSLKTQRQDLNLLRTELRQTKANKFETGQKTRLVNRSEE